MNNNQKDTKNTSLDSYGHSSPNTLINNSNYEFVGKKTEKLVTALYMVTDCMDSDEALKAKLRSLGVELLSDMHKIPTLLPVDKGIYISITLSHIHELLSFVGIASTIGFISEMNSAILHKEFGNLVKEIESYKSKDRHFTFTLNESMFEVERKPNDSYLSKTSIKDIDKGHTFKRTFPLSAQLSKLTSTTPTVKSINPMHKEERTNKILSFIKNSHSDAQGGLPAQAGLSIKDICIAFTDCGEKTIQRELNALVAKGAIKKIGAKRWSRYQAI